MIQTILIKLDPKPEQHKALLKTVERFNEACNYVSKLAFCHYTSGQVRLHHLAYRYLRNHYGLSAQMAVRAIGKVSETYRKDKAVLARFKPYSAMVFDQRILSFKGLDKVSILTLIGRQIIPIRIGEYQEVRINRVVRQTDLILRKNIFYLAVCVNAPEQTPYDPVGALGVDLGIIHLAVDSDGEYYSGKPVDNIRDKTDKLKASLQNKGTKSAKRHLKRLSGRESNFRRNTNHIISKKLVAKAKYTSRLIALEDLKGIGKRTKVRKAERRRYHSWAFYQLRHFITYKAKMVGVLIELVNPRYTSQTCPRCDYISKKNRISQSKFTCQQCGFASNADLVGATNISRKASVNKPIVSPFTRQKQAICII